MKVKEYIKITNYTDFVIAKDDEKGYLKPIFIVSKNTPIEYLSNELLDKEIEVVLIDEDYKSYKDEDALNKLFIIKVEE